jgi:archaeal type IV pilus assembly protein PilA
LTADQPPKDDCYIPPVTAGAPPSPGKGDRSFIILLELCVLGVIILLFIPPLLIYSMAGTGNKLPERVITVTAEQRDANTIVVTYHGGKGADMLVGLTVQVNSAHDIPQETTLGSKTGTIPLGAGENVSFNGTFFGRDYVQAIGWFSDGSEQVVLDTYV